MKIFIPTKNRQDIQHTAKNLAEAGIRAIYVIDENDDPPINPPFEFIRINCTGISNIRQAIIDLSDDDKICMMDDDLSFFVRDNIESVSLRMIKPFEIADMIQWLDVALDEYAHASISARTQNFQCTYRLQEANAFTLETVRPYRIYGFDKSVIEGEKLEFGAGLKINIQDDFHITLELLELGYPNIVNFKYAHEQRGSNSRGGAATYRDLELLKQCVENLKRLHPEVVKIVEKKTINSWGGTSEHPVFRTDVVIQWQKALGLRSLESKL
jgi:glycosyltransferase involved in cell wall biosynthesis